MNGLVKNSRYIKQSGESCRIALKNIRFALAYGVPIRDEFGEVICNGKEKHEEEE